MVALNETDKFTRFAWTASEAETVCVPDFFPGFPVNFDEAERQEGWEEYGDEANSSHNVLVVDWKKD